MELDIDLTRAGAGVEHDGKAVFEELDAATISVTKDGKTRVVQRFPALAELAAEAAADAAADAALVATLSRGGARAAVKRAIRAGGRETVFKLYDSADEDSLDALRAAGFRVVDVKDSGEPAARGATVLDVTIAWD